MNTNKLVIPTFADLIMAIALIISAPIVIIIFAVECIAALLPFKSKLENTDLYRPSIAILIPAYNEELVIGSTLESIIPQLTEGDRVIVVADNCNDQTVPIARSFEATVIERNNLQFQGKGYALDCGVKFLAKNPPEVVVIFDADCHVYPDTIDRLARLAQSRERPIQAVNLLKRQGSSNPKSSISELAFMVKNLVRPLGLARLGLPCLITMGTAYSWTIISRAPLSGNNLVEDMELGLDLALSGNPPLFCPDAKVTGFLPQKESAAISQRIRWEHGHLSTLRVRVPQLLKASVIQKRLDLLGIALDLSIPPISLLVMIWVIMVGIGLILGISTGEWRLCLLAVLEGAVLLVSIVGAWAKFGRKDIPLKSLLTVPGYILGKIQIYLTFWVKPQQSWIRTERNIVDDLLVKNIRN